MTQRLAYSLAEAAELSSLSVRSLRYLIAQGKLGFARVGRRLIIPHAEIERLLRRATVKATQPLDADEPIRPRKQKGLGRDPEALDDPC
jgi:excisionase family DNA binding protein